MYYPNGWPYQNAYYAPMVQYGMPRYQWNPGYAPGYEQSSNVAGMMRDYGGNPYVVDMNEVTVQNNNFRTALWTGKNLQLTLMSLMPGESIGLEMHPDVDQFLRVEQGLGITQMGRNREQLTFQQYVEDDSAIFIPAGTWHNLTNIGNIPLKLYSIYAPPNHPKGTVHPTKADAMAAEQENHY
ncbi:mannose-6-phosphate isomerase-like protein (cupin superfamily) [Ureibacillus xyleni]|uniref:Mannose-6-phosphate isomerase-like protein (Cupin superfamily) n=1 Tax=Ureibacillus xyleni TaxID=614648 RepID=A0A285TS86_9BACL|nr:cupin domain-containing protein [Ureibacillus xyleni]SOC24044.1 mannose-6-phosphate isomerase-like protein (cupin superfamily) [Ureibacillus xyleni]